MAEFSNKLFGENLKIALASAGMTQVQLADKLGTTGASISRYVKGERKVSPEMIVNMAVALNVSADELLGISIKGVSHERNIEHEILLSCFDAADPEFRTVLWTILEKYMTPEQRSAIHRDDESNRTEAM